MTIGDTIKDKQAGTWLTQTDLEILTLLKRCIGNEYDTLFSAAQDWFSLRALMELAKLTEYANPAEEIILEDLAIWILKQVLDYTNDHILLNFKQSLQQEPRRIVT